MGNLTIKISPVGDSVSGKSKRPQVDRDATRITKISGSEYQDDNSGLARVRLQQRIRIGRDVENEWQIDDLNVSRTHAEIVQNNSGSYEVVDLKSTNGTFLNGTRIKREVLRTGDIIAVGGFARRFTLDGLQILEGIDGMSISAREINFEIGSKPLLQDVSFNVGPRTLTAIVGPSGAGKSTLLGVLTGRTKPSSGQIVIGGIDLHTQYQSLSRQIGSVPQADILHTRLTVRQALNYGAKLRLPNDTSKTERTQRVNDVMEQLELTERADLRIDRLSGGQRKLLEMARALMVEPEMIMLDEPMAGVNPALKQSLLEHIKELRTEGKTVLFVEHDMDMVHEISDWVIVMAQGEVIAEGTPASVMGNEQVIAAYLGAHHNEDLSANLEGA